MILSRNNVAPIDSLMCDESWDLYIYLLLRDKTYELMDKYIGPLLIGKQDTLTDSWGWAGDPSFALMSRTAVHFILQSSIN